MSFDARRYTIDGLIKELLLLELHIRDGSVYECGCAWDAHLPLIEGLSQEMIKFAKDEKEKELFDRLMHTARDYRLALQYGTEGEEGMEVEGEHSSNPVREYTREEAMQLALESCRGAHKVCLTNLEECQDYLRTVTFGKSSGSSNPVGITGESERFIHETLQAKEVCDPASFRTVVRGEHRIVVCCPKGEWDESLPEGKQCRVGTVAQKILHPIWEKGEHAPEGR